MARQRKQFESNLFKGVFSWHPYQLAYSVTCEVQGLLLGYFQIRNHLWYSLFTLILLIILIFLGKSQWSILLLLLLLFGENSRKRADKEWKLARQFLCFQLPGANTEKEVPAVWFNKNQCLAHALVVGPVRLNWHKRSVSKCLHFISAHRLKLPHAFS